MNTITATLVGAVLVAATLSGCAQTPSSQRPHDDCGKLIYYVMDEDPLDFNFEVMFTERLPNGQIRVAPRIIVKNELEELYPTIETDIAHVLYHNMWYTFDEFQTMVRRTWCG